MLRVKAVGVSLMVLACVWLVPMTAAAQQASGIAGVVRDSSQGVLPGVTVEAASPALIEKVRTVVTDGEGRYSVADLRPGAYTVTFTLPGFSTVKREGIDLPGGFTATVNAELRVGALEETITVSGAAPLVDTQNIKRAAAVSETLLQALPSGSKSFGSLAAIVPGLTYQSGASTSGSKGIFQMGQSQTATFHGKLSALTKYDGMGTDSNTGGGGLGAVGYIANAYTAQEMRVETGGISAESNTSNVSFDLIPKEGSNTFNTLFYGHYASGDFQGSNLTDALRARGLTTVAKLEYVFDAVGSLGGPIKQDKLWFFTAHRGMGTKNFLPANFFNKTQGGPLYTPDLDRPAFSNDWLRSSALRFTWQLSAKNKVNIFGDNQGHCACRVQITTGAPETAQNFQFFPQGLYQATWNSPQTNKLLFEAGASTMLTTWSTHRLPGVLPTHINSTNLSTGYTYNSKGNYGAAHTQKWSTRFSASYITGSHALKVGYYMENGWHFNEVENNGGLSYGFLGSTPANITQWAYPYTLRFREKADLGIYAQDQWTVKRLTLNLGVRFDYFNTMVEEQDDRAGAFVPARHYDAIHKVPEWTNINPRLGVSYDLFGTGKTALKASLGRYNSWQGATVYGTAGGNNPYNTTVNSVTRTWGDANGNFKPDCNLSNYALNGECGAISNTNFGKQNPNATRYADDVLHGYGARDYFWDMTTELQHELRPGLSVTAGYYHSALGNFFATDNLDVTQADFTPFCFTAPTTSFLGNSLPGGGGYQVCGNADVSKAKYGQVHNLVTQAGNFGKQVDKSDFVGLSFNGRFARGVQLGGGVDIGRSVKDACFVIDSPMELQNCHVVVPFKGQSQVKLFGSVPLPLDIVVSGSLQNYNGPVILANYAAPNALVAPGLGRNLAACASPTGACSAAFTGIPQHQLFPTLSRVAAVGVPLITPFTQFDPRVTQVDMRLSKIFRIGAKMRLQANVDAYNLLNADGIQTNTPTYGGRWLLPSQVQDARLFQFGGQLTF